MKVLPAQPSYTQLLLACSPYADVSKNNISWKAAECFAASYFAKVKVKYHVRRVQKRAVRTDYRYLLLSFVSVKFQQTSIS